MRGILVVAWVAACAPGLSSVPNPIARNTLVAASGDERTIRKLLRDEVMNGGLWFPDPECVRQFPAPGPIHEDRLDAFAKCLATLKFEASEREDPFIDVAVMTYAPGIEVEALVVDDGHRGFRLGWIGYSARRNLADALPTISAHALETLRTAGDPNAFPDVHDDRAYAWLKICLDATGEVTSVHVRETTSLADGRAFAAAAQTWKFKPFVVGGKAIPACAMERLQSPPTTKPVREVLPLPVAAGDEETVIVATKAMEAHRVAGEKLVMPSDRTKIEMQQRGVGRVIGAIKLCIDENGTVTRVKPIRSTGFPAYDAVIVQAVSRWRYSPVIDEGHAVPVCTAVTFVYSQN